MYADENVSVDLDIAVQAAITSFVDDFELQWGIGANEPPEDVEWEEWYELVSLNAAAQHLVAASLRLYRPDGLPSKEVNWPAQLAAAAEAEKKDREEFLASLRQTFSAKVQDWPKLETLVKQSLPEPENFKHRFFLAAIQNHLADSFFPSLYLMSRKLVILIDHLTTEQDPQVSRYLESVSRCFLLDMKPELALMSRAVLEIALERRLPVDYMRAVRGIGSNRRVPLKEWIDEAAASGLIDAHQEAAAKRVSRAGGQVAHGKATDDLDPDSILTDLHTVVSALVQRSA